MKTWLRKQLSLVLALCMILSVCPVTVVAEDTVVSSEDSETLTLADTGEVTAVSIEYYTRIQVIHLLVDVLELEYIPSEMGHITFSDVTDPIDAQVAAIAVYYGVANGTSATTFNPDSYVTRAQLAQILFRALDLSAGTAMPSDVTSDMWFAEAVSAVVDANLMFTDANGNFYPNDVATTDDLDVDRFRELAASQSAPAATDLAWDQGINKDGIFDAPGRFSFHGTNGVSYELNLYRENAEDDILVLNKTVTPRAGFWNILPFHYEPTRCQTGDYYFTVQALGDGETYVDGPIQTSEVWSYTRPDTVLSASDLYWGVDMSMNWTVDEDLTLECELAILYNSTEDNLDGAWVIDEWSGMHSGCSLSAELLESYGTGWYYFSVIPATNDPTVILTPEEPVYSSAYYHESTAIDLPAAFDLQWHLSRWGNGSSEYEVGAISFGGTVPSGMDYVDYRVDVYRRGQTEDEQIIEDWWVTLWNGEVYTSLNPVYSYEELFTSGTYYFTVTPTGDGVNTVDGLTVTSGDWVYVRPDNLPTVTGLSWNADMSLVWTDGSGAADYFEIQFQHVGAGDQFDEETWHTGIGCWPEDNNAVYPADWMLHEYGSGKYYFRVRAMSEDITKAISSEWSEWSPAFDYTKPAVTLTPINLRWDSDTGEILFDLETGDESMVDYYTIRFYYSETNAIPDYRVASYRYYPHNAPFYIPTAVSRDYGVGYYWFTVHAITNDYTKALSGLGDSDPSGAYYFEGINNPAAAPIELQWNTYRSSNGSTNRDEPGTISFGRQTAGTWEEFRVDFYRKGTDSDVHIGEMWTTLSGTRLYRSLYPFEELEDVFTTGTYYFTVTPMGDGVITGEGQPIRSSEWNYTRPDVKLGVSNVHWKQSMAMAWDDATVNSGLVDHYEVQYQYVGNGNNFHEDNWDYWTSYDPDSDDIPYPPAELLYDYGNGQYYFRMRAMSVDILEAVSSDWSDWSGAFDYTKPATTLTVSDLEWNGNTLSWTPDFGADAPLANYQIYVYESEKAAVSDPRDWWTWYFVPADETYLTLDSDWIEELAGDTWYFTVTTITENPADASSNYGSAPVCEWTYQAPDTPAAAPIELQWFNYRNSSGSTNRYDASRISFGRQTTGTEEEFRVDFYRKNASGDVHIAEMWATMSGKSRYITLRPFRDLDDIFTTGTYYFTVTPMGDGFTTGEGKPVRSDDWDYTRPNVKLGMANIHWGSDMSINWTEAAQNSGHLDYYRLQYQFVGKGGTFQEDRWNYSTIYYPDDSDAFPYPPEDLLYDRGNGKYYFRIRAISDDVNEAVCSDWSDWSEAFNYTRPTNTLTVSNLQWEDNVLTWTPDFSSNAPLAGYNVYIYETYNDAVSWPDDWWDYYFVPADESYFKMPNSLLEDLVGDTWYFNVTTISKNPAAYNSNYGSAPVCEWSYTAPTTPAPAATDLQWNLYRNSQGSYSYEEPGTVSFGRQTTGTQEEFRVDFYRKETNSDVIICTLWANLSGSRKYARVYPFEEFADNFTTGTYYFTVTTMGDGVTTVDSQPVRSEDWTYTRPDIKLGVSNPLWKDNMSVSWTDASQNAAHTEYYSLRYQYVAQGDTLNPNNWNYGTSYWPDSNDSLFVPADLLMDRGSGKYYFQVRAMSADVTRAVHSDWTQWSAAFDYTRPANTLTVSDLKWEGNTLSWTADFDTDLLESYRIYVYEKAAYATANPDGWWDFAFEPADDTSFTVPQWMIDNLPRRTWYLAVTTLSADPATANSNYGSAPTAEWTYQAPETPAEPAFDLQWGVRRWQIGQSYEEPGVISFGGTVPQGADRAEFQIDIYRREADGNVKIGTFYRDLWSGDDFSYYQPFDEFADQFTTGTYFFTVTALGDGVNTCDSQPVTSPDWSYVRPDVTLGVSNPVWNSDMSIGWTDAPQNVGLLSYFDLEFRYVAPGQTFDPNRGNTYGTSYKPGSGDDPYPHDNMLWENGRGTYYFRMRAMPEDVTCAVPSGWTNWSTGFTYTRPSTSLTVSNLKWEGNTLSWTPDFDPATAPLLKYWIYVYENAGDAISSPWNNRTRYLLEDASATSFTLQNRWIDDLEGRDWYFAVVTVTSNPAKANSNWGSAPTCKWTYVAPSNKLGTPTNLRWHVDFEWDWDEVNDEEIYSAFTRYGSMAFDVGTPTQDRYDVELWQVKASGDVLIHDTTWGFGSTDERTSLSVPDFIYHVTESGTYYFKIRACSDDMNYADSDWATSPNWTYTAPKAQLGAPTGLYWDDYSIEYDGVEQIAMFWDTDAEAGYYEVEHFFSATEDGTPKGDSSNFDIGNHEGVHNTLHDRIIEERGEGWYYFRVRAISPDITKIRNSEWSAMSPAYNLSLVVDNANQKLDDILGDTTDDNYTAPTATQIQQAVEEIEHLDKAMAADAADGSTGTLEKLEQLEQLVMDELNIVPETNVDADVFTPALADKITVSNMALNLDIDEVDKEEETAVTLTISGAGADKPDTPEELNPAQYSNTLMFKMDIPEAKDNDPAPGKQLKIPVQITLPIPADINPNFLVVLHHKSDGTWEELRLPHIFKDGDQWYATFNVHEFSYYALSQVVPTAQAEGNTVIVDAHLPTNGVKTQYLCGVYSEQGQMLGMGILQPQAENALTITLDQPVPAGAYVKIFAPDIGDGWIVHSDAIEVEID